MTYKLTHGGVQSFTRNLHTANPVLSLFSCSSLLYCSICSSFKKSRVVCSSLRVVNHQAGKLAPHRPINCSMCRINSLVEQSETCAEKRMMGKQNVVVSEVKSMAMTMATRSGSSAVVDQQAAPSGSRRLCNYKRKILRRLQESSQGSAKVSPLVDSMRSSSPTSLSSSAHSEEHKSWMMNHPSALDHFEEIAKAAKGKKIVMFMDYDGTLSPIVQDPDKAFMSDEMRAAVKEAAKHFPTAIVTGRCIEKVCNFVKLGELYYAGSHGMDIKGPTKPCKYNKSTEVVKFQPASEFLPMIDHVYKVLVERTRSIPGSSVENNKFCLSVHFRCVEEKRWAELGDVVKSVVGEYPKLKLCQGRKVLEIRPSIQWDKGKALEYLLSALGFGPDHLPDSGSSDDCIFPVYIGDDRTDEDAFRVLRHREQQGLGILVTKFAKETSASYTLQHPNQVMYFLQRLVEWVTFSSLPSSRRST